MSSVATYLWFGTGQAEEAALLYVSVVPNSGIDEVVRREDGSAFIIRFHLDSQQFLAMNGDPGHEFTDAISISVTVEDQTTLDLVWDTLSFGGEEGNCGWLTDRFGVSWQVIPSIVAEFMSSSEAERSAAAWNALLAMKKLNIETLERAYHNA
ncbi:VOC family protein [Nocardia nova]|nr:VOC family protein [Nocardia nova]